MNGNDILAIIFTSVIQATDQDLISQFIPFLHVLQATRHEPRAPLLKFLQLRSSQNSNMDLARLWYFKVARNVMVDDVALGHEINEIFKVD